MAKKRKILFSIIEPTFGEFVVYDSANAWWKERRKVDMLLTSIKSGNDINLSCAYAGISRDNYNYFVQVHPDFKRVKGMCEQGPLFRALNTVNQHLDDVITARWYLGRRHPDFKPGNKSEEENPQPKLKRSSRIDMTKIEQEISKSADAWVEVERNKKERIKEVANYDAQVINNKELAMHIGAMAHILTEGSPEEIAGLLRDLQWDITNSGMLGLIPPATIRQ